MENNIERRGFKVHQLRAIRAEGDDGGGQIEGHAAVFDQLSVDLGGFREKIAPGAFAASIKDDDVRALWNHDSNLVLGRNTAGTLTMSEDKEGLSIGIDPPDTQAGRDALVSIERGDVSEMSFGFRVQEESWEDEGDPDKIPTRTLEKVQLLDVSPVTYPAYPQTAVDVRVAVRSLEERRAAAAPPEADPEIQIQSEARRRRLDLAEASVPRPPAAT